MRVLIAISPTMYWETLELALLRYRSHLDVRIADPDALDREVASFEPQVVVCHNVTPMVRESVPSWVEVPYHDSSDVTIHVQGKGESSVEDISIGDLFAVVDQTEELLSDTR
ncbi:MAG: hypothetical protein LC781_03715 [Actinobacteria bacterium]|nr:hypothetical protein [Actinomycetota bacterium]